MFFGSGYYNYDEGYTPDFPGIEQFGGTVVHPQHWPEDLDYTGKNVVVIGSGATAVTLLPSMSERAAKVTMLQRSPTYLISSPKYGKVAAVLRTLLPRKASHLVDPDVQRGGGGGVHFPVPQATGISEVGCCGAKRSTDCPTVTTSTPTSIRGTTPGTSECA